MTNEEILGLDDRQARNVAALELKRQDINNRFRGKIQIITTPEEAMSGGILAIPRGGSVNNKPVSFKLKHTVRDAQRNNAVVSEGVIDNVGFEDVLDSLKRKLEANHKPVKKPSNAEKKTKADISLVVNYIKDL